MNRILVVAVVACIGCMPGPTNRLVPGELAADGALRFASPQEFFAAVERVGKSSQQELDAWEQAIGFRSMRRGFAELTRELDEAPYGARAALLASNADLLDRDSVEPARRVRAQGYASLIDRRGIFYVGSMVHKVTADQVLSWPEGDPEPVEGSALPGNVHAFRYTGSRADSSSVLGDCGDVLDGIHEISDRRVSYQLYTYGYSAQGGVFNDSYYNYVVEVHAHGDKRNLFQHWVSYPTTFQLYNFAVDMDMLQVTSSNGNETQYAYVRRTVGFANLESSVDALDAYFSFAVGDILHNPVPELPVAPTFHKAHVEITSRGTFPSRGVLECEFCGDGVCAASVGESVSTCPSDCAFCGDGICTAANGEYRDTCSADCFCGNGVCDSDETYWDCWDCPNPCFDGGDFCLQ